MPTPAQKPIAGPSERNPGQPRVLVLRSARAAEFADAVRLAKRRNPGAEIVALSHRGHRETLRAAGVDSVIELPGRRFGLLRVPPWTLRRLRSERFGEIVIPQMTKYADVHMNLYRLVAALRFERIVIVPGEEPSFALNGLRGLLDFLRPNALGGVIQKFDVPIFLFLLLAACLVRRPAVAPRREGKRRVLHVISSMGVGGAQVQLAEVINRTPREEYELELLVLGRSDGDFSRQWLKRDDVSITYLNEWPRLTPSVLEVMDRCRRGRYDLVHTWLFMANIVAVAGARLAGVPLVIASVRNLSVWKRERWYRKWWHRTADVLGSHAADVVTVNAKALVADHARWALMRKSRIEVVHNGLDPSRFLVDPRDARQRLVTETGMPADAVYVGTVGRLAHEKDQATFLRILAAVALTRDDVRGVVIGDGELRARLEALAAELGLSGRVVFLGARSDARRLMAGLDLFVLTSRSEGFPNVLLEATFLGVPCVATDIAGNPDVLEFPESLFPAGDVESGAARALAALADQDGNAARQRAVRRRASTLFTAERSVATWLALYRRHFGDA